MGRKMVSGSSTLQMEKLMKESGRTIYMKASGLTPLIGDRAILDS
jgi:hypothetical protein